MYYMDDTTCFHVICISVGSVILSANHCVSVIQLGHMSIILACLSVVLFVHFSLGPFISLQVCKPYCLSGWPVRCLLYVYKSVTLFFYLSVSHSSGLSGAPFASELETSFFIFGNKLMINVL